ncbi:thioredoxin family protein [Chromobacterium haemolyticum]|nr:thioredoxin family protein [Chromobacterium haemolyticum]
MDQLYRDPAPERAQLDAQPGVTVLEFGAPWCGHCQAAQPLIQQALSECPGVRHLQIEDGPGRRLGRSYRVKLWAYADFPAPRPGSRPVDPARHRGGRQRRAAAMLAARSACLRYRELRTCSKSREQGRDKAKTAEKAECI